MGADLPPLGALIGATVGRKRRSIVIRRNPPTSWTRAGDLRAGGQSTRGDRRASTRPNAMSATRQEAPDDDPANLRLRRVDLVDDLEAGRLEGRDESRIPERSGDAAVPRIHGIGLEAGGAAVDRVRHRGVEKLARQPRTPLGFRDDEADDGPDGRVVDLWPDSRVGEALVVVAWRDADPTD